MMTNIRGRGRNFENKGLFLVTFGIMAACPLHTLRKLVPTFPEIAL